MSRPVALTGTPGTGKSAVARALAGRFRAVEVGELARELRCARRTGRGWTVDLTTLRDRFRPWARTAGGVLVVGHLAHLLPIRDVVVLRCHPVELERRLSRAHRGTPASRRENAMAEALDLVLVEAVGPGRRVWEIDTTGRPVDQVSRSVARRLSDRGPSRYGKIDWLGDPRVTDGLLGRPSYRSPRWSSRATATA